jgi:hypothetical protein
MIDLSRRKKARKQRVDMNRANDEQRYISEFPCQLSFEIRGYQGYY